MTRRTLTSVVVTVLLGVLVGAAFLLPVPYVIFSPGPYRGRARGVRRQAHHRCLGRQDIPDEG